MVPVASEPGVGVPPAAWGELVVLPENRSAVRAAQRVCGQWQKPRPRFAFACPLVFHGPTGAGKSAVVQALVRHVILDPSARTVHVLPASDLPRAAHDFADELTDLRTCDLLVVEDLHHLKPPDVEVVCRLLDHRAARRRPTVMTAPVGPANMTDLPRRLTSRLAAGLVVRVEPPGRASRGKLAVAFAAKKKLALAPAAADRLAELADGVRPLLGLVEKLKAVVKRSATPLTSAEVDAAVHDAETDADAPTKLQTIVARVCAAFRAKPSDVLGASRLRTALVPRQVAMTLAREVGGLTLVQIGAHFGGRDHSTVLHAIKKVKESVAKDAKLAATVRELRKGLR